MRRSGGGNALHAFDSGKFLRNKKAVPVVPTSQDCWEAVMVDMEGPSDPADKAGRQYTMTHIRWLCHGPLSGPKAQHAKRKF